MQIPLCSAQSLIHHEKEFFAYLVLHLHHTILGIRIQVET
jgi:hypothetical protein